jgi:hypothetical protein
MYGKDDDLFFKSYKCALLFCFIPIPDNRFEMHAAHLCCPHSVYRGADKSLAQPRRKQASAKEDIDVHISYSLS